MHPKAPVTLLFTFALYSPVFANSGEAAVCNANHIFNAIHSSMRQWGGSLNHNGMSLFLATVPEGTQLYHGTSNPDFIKGIQWLAFEPEHALIFARPHGPPPGERGPPGEGPSHEKPSHVSDISHDGEDWRHHEHGNGPPPPPHGDHHHDRPDFRPPHDDGEYKHHAPPPPHERKPSNGTERHPPPPPDHEHGPNRHGGHGPPPPLPPGHIYKPYPPPPRKEHSDKGPRHPWTPKHRGPPPRDHDGDSPEHHGPPPPSHHGPPPPSHHGPPPPSHHGPPPPSHHGPPPPSHHGPPPPSHHGDLPPQHNRPKPDHREHHGPPPREHDEHREHLESIELRSNPYTPKDPNRLSWKRHTQQPLNPPTSEEPRHGYLHTYAPTHDLHLLYIDGLSAGKTSNGTLDTQDLLLNLTSSDSHGPMGGEMARAQGLCDLAATAWEGKVDGVIRLEGGFEIILCDFEKHLERVDVMSVSSETKESGPMGGWEYTKAIASRYHGIGGGRVHVDYEKFVSVFAYPDVKRVWDNDVQSDVRMPRLTNVSPSDLLKIKDDVTALILAKDWNAHPGRDWQAVSDLAVQRYSKPLHHITHTRAFRKDKEELARYLQGLLRPFVDAGARNATLETARCVAQILPPVLSLSIPPGSVPPLAHRALHTVGKRICDTLLTSLSIATSATPHSSFQPVYAAHAVEVVDELVEWLGWTSWKECGTCGDEEVCFIPIWPMGTLEDHSKPQCRGAKEVEGRMGYWGVGRGGPPGGKPPGGKPTKNAKNGGEWWKL